MSQEPQLAGTIKSESRSSTGRSRNLREKCAPGIASGERGQTREKDDLGKLFFVILLLNTTGLFRFLAPPLSLLMPERGVTISDVSVGLLVLNIAYFVYNAKYIAPLFRGGMAAWSLLLLVFPLLTILVAPSLELRQVGIALNCFSLFLGVAVYTMANGLPACHRLLSISLVITAIGVVSSMVVPEYFGAVERLAGAHIRHSNGRSFGFFMHPNRLAVSLTFLFIGWFALFRRKNSLWEPLALLALLLAMLLTGSRSGALLVIGVIMLIFVYSVRTGLGNGSFAMKAIVLLACLFGGQIAFHCYVSGLDGSAASSGEYGLVGRMKTLLSLKLTNAGSLREDTSLRERIIAQTVYWELVNEKPVLGHGFGADSCYYRRGRVALSAHSMALTDAMEYGVPYTCVFCLMMVQLCWNRNRRGVESALQTNSILQFVSITLVCYFFGEFSELRVFYVILGIFFVTVRCPQYVFHRCPTGEKVNRLTRNTASGVRRHRGAPAPASLAGKGKAVRRVEERNVW